jgi:hypothetical protein
MAQSTPAEETRPARVLIPLDAEAAMRALMNFRHSRGSAAPQRAAAGEADERA